MKIGSFEFKEPIPSFDEAHVIAMLYPWLDAGSVGTLTLRRLERYFDSQELGRLEKPARWCLRRFGFGARAHDSGLSR